MQAVFRDQSKDCVFIVNDDNVVERRVVEASRSQRGLRTITGLNRNDIVIADPVMVKSGMAVKPDRIAGALESLTPPFEFVETPLTDIVDYLKEELQIIIEIDERGLVAAKVDRDIKCTLNIRGVSFASALRLLLRQVGLSYVVEDGYILVTAPGSESNLDAPKPSGAAALSAQVVSDRKHAAAPLPTVRVTQPIVCNVCDYEEYAGTIQGKNDVPIRMPVKGIPVFRIKIGAMLNKRDVLAEIVARDDWAKVREKGEALNQLELASPGRNGRGGRAGDASPSSADAEAQWKAALAEWNLARGDIKTVKILAPCSGNFAAAFGAAIRRLGRGGMGGESPSEMEAGALIGSISASDSMLVWFNIDERAVLAHRRVPNRKPNWELSLPVVVGLADDKGFPYRGEVTHVAADIDPNTHAQRWQAVVPNKDGIFMPGMSVRLRLITSEPHKVMLVPHSISIRETSPISGGRADAEVLIVNDRNLVESRKVSIGQHYDGFVSIQEGLKSNDWVVIREPGSGMGGRWNVGSAVAPEKVTTPPPPWASISVPPSVTVAHPVVREVTDYQDFTGHVAAAQTAEMRARASGNLDKVSFRPGMSVKKGDVLFEIDPRLYQAELDQAAGGVKQAQIRLNARKLDFDRMQVLANTKAVSQEEIDKVKAERDEAEAAVQTAEAALNVARVRLDYTKITAPFDGRISRSMLDPGNLVAADKTVLATLASTDPMYVYFDVDQQAMLTVRRTGNDRALSLPVSFALPDEKGFSHPGKMDSADSRIDPGTGMARWRAALPNKDGMLSPGMFVRVRLATSAPHRAIVVPKGAVISEGPPLRETVQWYVLTVNDRNVVERRDVEPHVVADDDRSVSVKGLSVDDLVIMSPVYPLKPGMTVTPEKSAPAAK